IQVRFIIGGDFVIAVKNRLASASIMAALMLQGTAYGVGKAGITYGEPGRIDGLNPYTAHEASISRLSELMFDSLITLSETGDYVAHLAKAWQVGSGNTYVDIVLRDGVSWH